MATFTNGTMSSSVYTNGSRSGFSRVGDLPISYFDGLAFDDVVPGAGGKTLGELTFDDLIDTATYTNQTKNSSSYSNQTKN